MLQRKRMRIVPLPYVLMDCIVFVVVMVLAHVTSCCIAKLKMDREEEKLN